MTRHEFQLHFIYALGKHSLDGMVNLGILGGGQLARMLALTAAPLGIKPHVLSEFAEDPAAQVTSYWRRGNPHEASAVREFAKNLDFLTFESEFIDASVLKEALSGLNVRTFPNLDSLERLQDRKSQKDLLKSCRIPTSPFVEVSTAADLQAAFELFHGQFVLKLRKNGYDGKGTFFCSSERNLDELSALLKKYPQGFIAEAIVAFKSENALMLFRNAEGEVVTFPMVETHQTNNRCDWVLGPTTHPRLKVLIAKLKKMMVSLNYVGALGVELFLTDKDLLVNELAPRVHNSGHFSQNAMSRDQFTLHLLCGVGAQLETPTPLAKAFGMVNLLGTHTAPPVLAMSTNSALHWYGKFENRPGRKMGHLNGLGVTRAEVLKILLRERKKFNL